MARLSRAKRCAETCAAIRSVLGELSSLERPENYDELTNEEKDEIDDKLVKQAQEVLGNIDTSEIDNLKSEMESWRDNLDGANMSHLPKYDQVSECADVLDNALSTLEGLSIDGFEEIESVMSEAEEAVNEAEGAEFPGMYG